VTGKTFQVRADFYQKFRAGSIGQVLGKPARKFPVSGSEFFERVPFEYLYMCFKYLNICLTLTKTSNSRIIRKSSIFSMKQS